MARGMQESCDVLVIGTGPAGMAAASLCARHGLDTLAVDERAAPGGHAYREEYAAASKLSREFLASGARYRPGTSAQRIGDGLEVALREGASASSVRARRIIVATGAIERDPRIEAPHGAVETATRAQAALLESGRPPAGPLVLAGTGALLWTLAAQYLRAGARIEALLDTAPRSNRQVPLRAAVSFAFSPQFGPWLRMRRDVRSKVRHVRDVRDIRVQREGEGLRIAYRGGEQPGEVRAAHVVAHEGLVPNIALLREAGAQIAWDPVQLCDAPLLDHEGETTLAGVSVAGDAAGVAGAQAAAWRGVILGLAAVKVLRPGTELPAERLAYTALERFMRGRRFLDRLYRPRADDQ